MTKTLIVDDERRMCRSVELLLARQGHEVRSAETGREALETIRRDRFDLVLLDLNLPDLDGHALMRGIRGKDPLTSIVILTGDSSTAAAIAALKQGAFDYLRKPYDSDTLIKTVQNALESQAERRARKRAEESLRKKTQELEDILRSISDGFFTLDENLRVMYFNKAGAEILGRQPEEVLGRNLFDAFPEAKGSIFEERYRLALEERRALSFETYFGVPPYDDWYQVRVYPNSIGISVFFQVTTAQKEAAERLQRSERRYRSLFDDALDMIHIVDANGTIVDANPAELKRLGYTPEEYLGKSLMEIVHPDYRSNTKKALKRVLAGERVGAHETALITKTGERIDVEVNATPEWIRGKIVGGRAIFRDLTDRKRLEAEREKLQMQLFQAQKLESVGRLAGGVAHDFNNMLGVILGHIEMALDNREVREPLHTDLVEIQKAARRSADITRQLLAFARKQTIDPEVLDLNETVEGMLKMLRRLIGEDIHLNWHSDAELWPVKMDPVQIDQVLANLCVNARDALTGVGNLTIETANVVLNEAYCTDHAGFLPGEYVMLAVSDDGCGIEKEGLAKVFEPFYTTKEDGKGTGLGLSTVYGIAKQNEGFVNLYSEPGKGTTIKIYLPRYRGKMGIGRIRSTDPKPEARGETILVVEDEMALLEVCQSILEGLGYTVLTADRAGKATEVIRDYERKIDLLITDVVMPEMNGRELAEAVRGIQKGIKVLFMSGYTANAVVHRGILDEGIRFVQKPFTIDGLAKKVREVLDESPAHSDDSP